MTGPWVGGRTAWPPSPAQPQEARPGTRAPHPRGRGSATQGCKKHGGSVFTAFVMNRCLGRNFSLNRHLLPGPPVRCIFLPDHPLDA